MDIDIQKVTNGAVTSIYTPDVNAGWEQEHLHMSDVHYDSIYCDLQALTEDLDSAKKKNARVYMFGDLFDAMQGRYDYRRNMDELREKFRTEKYFDVVVDDFAEFLAPYAPYIELMAVGNHELAIQKHNNISLLDRLVYKLNREHGGNITIGGYGGWVLHGFGINGSSTYTVRQKYFHGSGGEAPVTRGVIQTNRQATFLPDADIITNGHNHHAYIVPISRERVTNGGSHYFDIQYHIRVPGYKNAYGDGTTGWEVSRGGVPKPIGCAWVKYSLTFDRRTPSKAGFIRVTPHMDVRGPALVESVEGLYEGAVYPDD